MDRKQRNLNYLDGLRGWASLVILIHHYVLIFFTYLISEMPANLAGQILTIPIRIFVAGKFMIYIFFTLSGFVLVYKYFLTMDSRVIISSAGRRYFRLILPTGAAVLFAYLLMKLDYMNSQRIYNVTNGWVTAYNFKPDIFVILQNMFIVPFRKAYLDYNGVIFTISYEIIASFTIYFLVGLFGKYKIRFIIYLLALLIISAFFDTYYLPFVLGLALCDLFIHFKKLFQRSAKWYITFPLLGAGLYFGTYPYSSYIFQKPSIYSPLVPLIGYNLQNNIFLIGALFMLFVALTEKTVQNILETKFMQFFGKISFSLYLLHYPFALGISVPIFSWLRDYFSHNVSAVITFIISACLLFPLVYLFYRYVEIPITKGTKYAYSYLEKKLMF